MRSSSASIVVINRAPVAPMGCPSAMPPPLTLTRSCGAPVSFIQASGTEAKASLHSKRSMSSTPRPARSSACLVAGMGPVSIHTGSSPRTERCTTRARGVSPCSATARSEATSSALAPSQIWDATAAVTRPPGASGSSPAIFDSDVSRGHWSVSTTVPSGSVTGSISPAKRPSAIAVRARSCETSANSSISSREMPHFSAIISAERNWLTSWSP